MKKIVYILLILTLAGLCFLSGMYISNKEDYDIKKSWDEIQVGLETLDENKLVANSSSDNTANLKSKFNTIISSYDIDDNIKIVQSDVIAKSYAILEQNNSQNSKYAIVRVYITYDSSADVNASKFLYFYFYREKGNFLISRWSLFNIETEESVTIK